MSHFEIRVGTPVKSSEGKHLGDVDRLIVDVAANRLEFLVIDKGIFSEGRLVEVRHIARADEHEVVLTLGTQAASNLPVFAHEEFVRARGTMTDGGPVGGMVDTEGPGNKWMIYGSDAGQCAHTGTQPLFMAPPIGTDVTKDISNVPESDVTIGKGTRVVDRDFKTIGHVDELLLDDEQRITGVLVKTGHLIHHTLRVPRDWVGDIAHDYVRLNVTKDYANETAKPE